LETVQFQTFSSTKQPTLSFFKAVKWIYDNQPRSKKRTPNKLEFHVFSVKKLLLTFVFFDHYVTSLIANFSPTAVKIAKALFLNTIACLWKNNENLTFFDATKVALEFCLNLDRSSFVFCY
jgi:hypothetical protein